MGDSDLSRRGFLTLTGGAALASTAGCLSGDDTGPAAFLLGPDANKPAPGGDFFDNKTSYRYLYFATDTGVRYKITTGDDTWTAAAFGGGNDTRPVDELPVGGVAAAFEPSSQEFVLRARPGSDEGYEARVGGNQVLEPGIPNSVIAQWEFNDDGDTTTASDSVNGYDLSISGPTYTSNAKVGSHALSFDGTDDTADASTSLLDESSAWTVCGWVKRDTTGVGHELINNARNVGSAEFLFRINDADRVETTLVDGSSSTNYTSTLTVGSGAYTFVGFAFDGATSATFKVDDQTQTVSGGTFANLSKNWAVGYAPFSSNTAGVDLDDWHIADAQLTDAEMEDIRTRGV